MLVLTPRPYCLGPCDLPVWDLLRVIVSANLTREKTVCMIDYRPGMVIVNNDLTRYLLFPGGCVPHLFIALSMTYQTYRLERCE